MSVQQVLVTPTYLEDIADAIRAKNGSSDTYKPGQMASAIANIPGGITPTGTVNITQNGTHDVTQYAEANVSVLPNLQSKTVTENGTVTPDSGYDGLSSVVVNVSGGGGSSEQWDLTESFTGKSQGWVLGSSNVTRDSSGAHFNRTDAYLRLDFWRPGFTIEIDFGAVSLQSGNHRRVLMCGGEERGFIYRSSGVWALYNWSWQDSSERNGAFFDNSTLKIEIDANGYWHVYKNNVLFFEPTVGGGLRGSPMYIGAPSNSMNNATVTGLRVY